MRYTLAILSRWGLMAIVPGRRLGPYEILSAIGAGGMGEVYKARDTRLDRIVAIKVLPAHLADRADLRERFDREAKTIASLNHPHICTLYDTGHQEDIDFLVMEYLEGETLAQRLVRSALPIQLVLQYAIQISDALDKAHRKGVTHRDLKPGNIMLTKSGTKLLDFGLAKLHQGASPATPFSELPTEKVAITAEGSILGTLQYMAPEQVEGKEVDARTDIFSFGVVVYEMATGKRAFEGRSQASLIAKILEADPPPMSSLQPMTPPTLDRVVKKCLRKDRDDRWQSARDVTDELKWITEGTGTASAAPSIPVAISRPWRLWALVAGLTCLVVVGVALRSLMHSPSTVSRPISRLLMTLPANDRLRLAATEPVILSPNGSRLVYAANRGGINQLFIRAIDSFDAKLIPGTEGAFGAFFSPDGQSIGFIAGGKLNKVSLNGGAPMSLANTLGDRGASWGPDDTIIYAPTTNSGLFRVSAAGGTPNPLTFPDRKAGEYGYLWPQFLPGGKEIIFTIWSGVGGIDHAKIGLLSLDTGKQRVLVEGGTYARYVPSGHIVYARAGGLLAVPFDLQRLEVTGAPVSILEGVGMDPSFGSAYFSSSADGLLAYVPGGLTGSDSSLVWVDRKGMAQVLPVPPRAYDSPRLSPDGKRLAVGINGNSPGLWIYDLERGTLTKLIEAGVISPYPIWTPDGKDVTFKAPLGDPFNLYTMPADGSGAPERLTTNEDIKWPGSWSPDGRVLAFIEQGPTAVPGIQVIKLEGDRNAQTFSPAPTSKVGGVISPDGRWIAYESSESGRAEVYVQPFPNSGGRWQISTDGGTEPVWNRNGREMFYRTANKLMAVDVVTQAAFSADKPRLILEGRYMARTGGSPANYDVSPDGQRFVMIKSSDETPATQINIVQNWFDELKQKVPTGKK
jgi:serine/threonine protein kinase/Tol biopolymer transport system component